MLYSTKRNSDRRGAILVLIAILIPVFALMAAFAVDVAWMQLVRTELRTATDAAARAGAKELSIEQNTPAAEAAAIDAASRNLVGGAPLRVAPGNIQFGTSERAGAGGRFAFNAGATPINGVRVNGLRTNSSLGGPVPLFFGRVLGVNSFQPQHTAISTMLDRDICLVIDRSGSMNEQVRSTAGGSFFRCTPPPRGSRFLALADAVDVFLAELDLTLPNEQVALVSYSSEIDERCRNGRTVQFPVADIREPLTPRYRAIRDEMTNMKTNLIGGSTAIGEGLTKGLEAIASARPFAIPTVVLLTDGRHNTSFEPIIPARTASARNIVVHTITFSRGADQGRMRAVADETGGRHFHADTAGDLAEVFRTIARTLPVLLTE